MSQEFVSHDGEDGNGVRAEVVVIKGKGIVKELALGNNDKSVQASIFEENLALPIKGWVNVDTAIHRELVRAKEAGYVVEYRIEIQRKNHIDRALPMDEVRPKGDMLTANKNAIRIVAQINDVISDEAVTHPSEDQVSAYGRHKATEASKKSSTGGGATITPEALTAALTALTGTATTQDVQAAAVGAAIALGLAPEEAIKAVSSAQPTQERPAQRAVFSAEGKPWDLWNSDGKENLGHARFAAGTGAETFVRKALTKAGIADAALEDGTLFFSGLLLSIADRVQVKAYGEGFRPDRSAGSHTRIRSIVYDTIENYYPLPLETNEDASQTIKNWIAEVGNQTFERLQIVIEISNAATSFSAPLPELIYGTQKVQTKTSTPKTQEVVTPEQEEPEQAAEPETPKKVEEPTTETEVEETIIDETPDEVSEEPEDEETTPEIIVTTENMEVLPPFDIASLSEKQLKELATEETITVFRELIEEAEIPDSQLTLVASLLRKTFGSAYGKAQTLPEAALAEFVDFYTSNGPENFKAVVLNS